MAEFDGAYIFRPNAESRRDDRIRSMDYGKPCNVVQIVATHPKVKFADGWTSVVSFDELEELRTKEGQS